MDCQCKEARYYKQRRVEHCVNYAGGDRGDRRHWLRRHGADGRDDGRNDGRDDELRPRYGRRMVGRASVNRHNCGCSHLALAA